MNRTIQQFWVMIAAMLFYATSALALDVNRASVADLQNVKGVGPVIAKRIASERKKTKFKSLADLQERVPGVGPQIAANLSKGSGLPRGKAKAASKTKIASSRSSKTAKAKVTEIAVKRKSGKSTKTAKTKAKIKKTKKVAKANTKSVSKTQKKTATKKLAKKISNNKKK